MGVYKKNKLIKQIDLSLNKLKIKLRTIESHIKKKKEPEERNVCAFIIKTLINLAICQNVCKIIFDH